MKRTILIALASVMMTVFFAGDALANRYLRINGIWIECCSNLTSTVIISDFEALKYDPIRVVEYSNLAGTVVCRHNNTGMLVGNAWTGPEGRLTHSAKFTVVEDGSEFDRDRKFAESITSGDILDVLDGSGGKLCPSDAFTLEDIQLTGLDFVDSIYICSEFGGKGKNKVCQSLTLVDSLEGSCAWVDGEHRALCTETSHLHFDVDTPGNSK